MAVLTYIEVAVNGYTYIFKKFKQRKKGKETVPSIGIIQQSRRKLDVDLE